MMACIATTTADSVNPCCSSLSTSNNSYLLGSGNKRRPFDSVFDFEQVTKRFCRCSDAARYFDQSQATIYEEQPRRAANELEIKKESANFSLARAIFDISADEVSLESTASSAKSSSHCGDLCRIPNPFNPPVGNPSVSLLNDRMLSVIANGHCGALQSNNRRVGHLPFMSSSSTCCGGRRHDRKNVTRLTGPTIEKPQMLEKMIERLQQEIYHLDRKNQKRRERVILPPESSELKRTVSENNRSHGSTVDQLSSPLSDDIPDLLSNSANGEEASTVLDFVEQRKRLYTFRQLCRICQRLLREQESHLHQYYEHTLTKRLSEQYDCFLKFTDEQLNQRFQNTQVPSYIS